MMPRTRSKDSIIQINNNLNNYKVMSGPQRVVEAGRLDSQRLLLENYHRRGEGQVNMVNPINLKRHQYQQQ